MMRVSSSAALAATAAGFLFIVLSSLAVCWQRQPERQFRPSLRRLERARAVRCGMAAPARWQRDCLRCEGEGGEREGGERCEQDGMFIHLSDRRNERGHLLRSCCLRPSRAAVYKALQAVWRLRARARAEVAGVSIA